MRLSKRHDWRGISLQNLQTAHEAEYDQNKQPNQKMDRRPKYTFLQGKHIDGQHAHENILNIASY